MKELNVALFTASSEKGKELEYLLCSLFKNEQPAGFKINMEVITDGDQADMMIAGLKDDIVIFDASVEDVVGSNYKAAQMWPSCMEHFLVVSRTLLPLNFQAFHEGGTPDTFTKNTERPITLDNPTLINWIVEKLEFLKQQLPRPSNEKFFLEKNQFFSHPISNQKSISEISEKIMANSHKRKNEHQKSTGRAFVSYLSRYSKHCKYPATFHDFNVESIFKNIRDKHNDIDYPILYYPPGTLTSEFMTEQRRWQVFSIIDWRIRSADEFYIFETPDYYNSWWTLAELASFAYIQNDSEHPRPKIFLCKPISPSFIEIKLAEPDFVQQLDEKTKRDFGRRLSNSDPLTMGYERISNMQKLAKLPMPLQWIHHKMSTFSVDYLMSEFLPNTYKQNKKTKMDFAWYREMIQSDVFRDSFWKDRIVTCPNCSGKNKEKHHFNFDAWLHHKQLGQYRISPKEMDEIFNSGIWTCTQCKYSYRIIKEASPQLIWWPVKMGQATGPNGVFIEQLPVYSLETI